jgi:hypothetical protein
MNLCSWWSKLSKIRFLSWKLLTYCFRVTVIEFLGIINLPTLKSSFLTLLIKFWVDDSFNKVSTSSCLHNEHNHILIKSTGIPLYSFCCFYTLSLVYKQFLNFLCLGNADHPNFLALMSLRLSLSLFSPGPWNPYACSQIIKTWLYSSNTGW